MATPSKPKTSTRKPSQTARILEHVEMLLALQEEMCERTSDTGAEAQVNASSEELCDLLADKTDEFSKNVEFQINQRFERLESKIEKINESILNRPETSNESPQEIDSDAIASSLESLLGDRFASLESRLSEVSSLESRIEQLNESILNRPETSNESPLEIDSDAIANSLESRLGEGLASFESKLGTRLESLESRLSEVSEALVEQSLAIETVAQSRGEGELAECDSSGQQAQLEETVQKLTEKLGEKTDSIANDFNSKIEAMFADLGSRVSQISQGINQFKSSDTDSETDSDSESQDFKADGSASHWHKQKAAMLSKYGIDPEYRPVMELPATDMPKESAEDAESETTANMSDDDAAEIAGIKERLNEKLREAEVELSINRAKLSQQRAELESVQVELDRRASAIEEKYAAVANAPQKRRGFLERITRLGGKKQKPKS